MGEEQSFQLIAVASFFRRQLPLFEIERELFVSEQCSLAQSSHGQPGAPKEFLVLRL